MTKIIKAFAKYKGVEINITINTTINQEIREIHTFKNKFKEVILLKYQCYT